MSSVWDRMTLKDRLTACHIDIANNAMFATLSGVVYVGKADVSDETPTARTNGCDVEYGAEFIKDMTRKQLRYLVLHENLHKALHHCTAYKSLCLKYPQLVGIAMDYVVNGTIEETDPELSFVERPTNIPPLVDKKYFGWSFVEVLQDLIREVEEAGGDPTAGEGQGVYIEGVGEGGGTLDEHEIGQLDEAKLAKANGQIADALHQGKLLADKLAGKGKRGSALDSLTQKRDTNWREHLREFVTTLCEGDEYSRFSPPNKRMLPQGIIMPSHFSESTGELVVACDASGSMWGILPTVFGEIARICENVRPEQVRVLFWEYEIVGEQIFKPQDYDKIADLLKPCGGGGTRLTCVAEYLTTHRIKPKATIILSDGYIESDYILPDCPTLFGAVDNDHFVASSGKTVRIYSN